MTNQISIIIPMLNEADNIASVLQHLLDSLSSKNTIEIFVIDGGSTDGSEKLVLDFISVFPSKEINMTLLYSEKGRAKQMNLGAKHASGDILYFLHADSFPPRNFDQLISNEVAKNHLAGCFQMQFDNNHWWLRLAGWLTHFKWRACRGGDQSQFITKKLFDDIGGFDESFTIYEDNILINELYKREEFVVIQDKIKTSARLYEKHGIWTLQYHFWTIYVKKWLGATPDSLYKYYQRHIS